MYSSIHESNKKGGKANKNGRQADKRDAQRDKEGAAQRMNEEGEQAFCACSGVQRRANRVPSYATDSRGRAVQLLQKGCREYRRPPPPPPPHLPPLKPSSLGRPGHLFSREEPQADEHNHSGNEQSKRHTFCIQ